MHPHLFKTLSYEPYAGTSSKGGDPVHGPASAILGKIEKKIFTDITKPHESRTVGYRIYTNAEIKVGDRVEGCQVTNDLGYGVFEAK